MKKILLVTVMAAVASVAVSNGQVATNVAMYFYPCSLPDVTTSEFGTARDNLLTGICYGGPLDTRSRVAQATGIEIRNTFESSDMGVSATSSSNLWRAVFNPPAPFAAQHGQRIYCPPLLIGTDGKLSLDRVSYQVICGVSLLNNQSALAGLDYSVSRVGILAGPDGKLFTADDVFVKSGSGTALVDAIAFIGGRIGALVANNADFRDGTKGFEKRSTTFIYSFNGASGPVSASSTIGLYARGGIPDYNKAHLVPFIGPNGVLFSIVGPPGMPVANLLSSGEVTGPWGVASASATEGTSGFAYFTRIPGSDMAYFRIVPNAAPSLAARSSILSVSKAVSTGTLKIVSSPSSDSAQN